MDRAGPRTIVRWLALSVALCTLANGGGSVRAADGGVRERHAEAARQSSVAENAPLPELALPDLSGASRPLRLRPGEVTVLNFWATWCVPCFKELPELVKLSHEWQERGVQVVGIAIDSGSPTNIRTFAVSHGMDYRLLVGNQRWAAEHFGVFGLPVTLVVDRAGRIRQRLIGPQTGVTFTAAVRPYL